MNFSNLRLALWTAALILSPLLAYKGAGKVKRAILAHDQVMLGIAVEETKTARYEALRACLRRHILSVCREIP